MRYGPSAEPRRIIVFPEEAEPLSLLRSVKRINSFPFPLNHLQVKNTQISFVEKHLYACVSFLRFKKSPELPKDYFVLTLGMPYLVQSPRLKMAVEPYPGRFTTHIPIGSIEDIDNELMGWLADVHRFALTK